MKVYYLAHPIAADDLHTVEENLEHILVIQDILRKHNIFAVAPYWTYVKMYGSGRGKPDFSFFIEGDKECVRRMGNIILAGHRISYGMEQELSALEGLWSAEIIDLTRLTNKEVDLYLEGTKPNVDNESVHP